LNLFLNKLMWDKNALGFEIDFALSGLHLRRLLFSQGFTLCYWFRHFVAQHQKKFRQQ